jgi:hypothetical protein
VPQRVRPGQGQDFEPEPGVERRAGNPPVNDPKYKGLRVIDRPVLRVWDAQHAVEWILLFTAP